MGATMQRLEQLLTIGAAVPSHGSSPATLTTEALKLFLTTTAQQLDDFRCGDIHC